MMVYLLQVANSENSFGLEGYEGIPNGAVNRHPHQPRQPLHRTDVSWIAPQEDSFTGDTVEQVAEVVEVLVRAGGGLTNSSTTADGGGSRCATGVMGIEGQELTVADRVVFVAASEPKLLPLLEAILDDSVNQFARPMTLEGRSLSRWGYVSACRAPSMVYCLFADVLIGCNSSC